MKDVIIKIINSRKDRREPVHEKMFALNDAGKSCQNCTGICCTAIANSMQIDLVQAFDLYIYLQRRNRFDGEALQKNIDENQIKILSTGKGGQQLRKRYTCPFYTGKNLGCSISINSKPYGCLAFNPIGEGVKDGENCRSYQESLQTREEIYESTEAQLNSKLAKEFQLIDDRQAIPIKLLEVHQAITKTIGVEKFKAEITSLD
jgi:Fe-S-cluster containining protein